MVGNYLRLGVKHFLPLADSVRPNTDNSDKSVSMTYPLVSVLLLSER